MSKMTLEQVRDVLHEMNEVGYWYSQRNSMQIPVMKMANAIDERLKADEAPKQKIDFKGMWNAISDRSSHPPAQPTNLEDAVHGWHSVANPPDGKTDLWSRDVIGLTNGREVMRVAYFRGKDGGVWQRPNGLVVTGERIVAWRDLPELSEIENKLTAALQENAK